MLGKLIASRTAFQESMIVEYSRHFIVIRSGYLVLRCLRVLFLTTGGHGTQFQNLSSEQHTPHPVRHASPGTVKS